MEKDKLLDIASEAGYDVVETTSGVNGYPADLKYAVTGFEDFESAQEFAKMNGLTLISLHKRDGWQLWERGGSVSEPYKNSAELFGENYSQFSIKDESSYFKDNVRPHLSDFDDIDSLKLFLEDQEEIIDEFISLEDDEIIIVKDGKYYDTYKKEVMSYSYDTHNYIICAI